MLRGAIQRPIAVCMFFAAMVLMGVLGAKELPVDLLPSIIYPRLTVLTTYEDIPAADLERLVTQSVEEVVTALTGVRGVTSRTREGVSTITVEYEWGTNMDFANLHLREAVDRVAFRDDFPDGADRPVILRWDPTSRPVSILVLKGDGAIEALTEFAREVVKPALEQVDGISQGELVGGADREILVEPDARKMAIYDISMADIQAALVRSNISFPGGRVRQGPLHLSLRIDGEYETLEEIRSTDITRPGQGAVRISDVAVVRDTVKDPEGVTMLAEVPVVSLLIYKEPEANTIDVSDQLDIALETVSQDYPDFEYDFVYRDAEYVKASFDGLRSSLLLGGGLAILVLFTFLSDWRSPLVVGLSIPVSIVITLGLLFFGDVNLNLMSLGGLSLAAGMLVDNAIVVLENINRHLSEQKRDDDHKRKNVVSATEGRRRVAEASYQGTTEMARPVIASTLTTIAVFFPVVYVPGIAGAFFRDQALTVTFSLIVSVVAALLLQPVLSARLLRTETDPNRGHLARLLGVLDVIHGVFYRIFRMFFDAFYKVYHSVLLVALRMPALMLVLLLAFLSAAGLLAVNLDRSFMPERSQGDLRIDLELPSGTPLEETARTVGDLAAWIDADPSVRAVFSQVGRTERTLAAMEDYTAPHTAKMRIIMESGRGAYERGQALQASIQKQLENYANVKFAFREEGIGLGEILATGGASFSMGILAENPLEAVASADELLLDLANVDGLYDLKVDRVLGTPNVVVRVDREEVLRNGLDPDIISRELRARIAGVEATTFNEVEQRVDISVRFSRDERFDLSSALSSPVRLSNGQTVPLHSFLELTEERPVRELVRRNQRRMVVITGDVRGRNPDDVWNDAQAVASAAAIPAGVRVVQEGERKEMRKSFRDLGMAMLLAIVLVYMILAAQFESFLDPFLIACVIPIGLAGAAIAIGVTGGTVNILSLIGLLALLGIAVNDAIVKIDTMRRLQEGGMPGFEAILEASRLRLRPILMTSITTVLAMLPMAIGLGSGEQLQRPLAITIIGGLTMTTLLTLIYTPILYMVAHRIPRPREAKP